VADLSEQLREALAAVESAGTLDELEALRVRLLGRNGEITAQLKALGALPAGERPAAGKAVNRAKNALSAAIAARKKALSKRRLDAALSAGGIDVSLPGRGVLPGAEHPLSRTIRRVRAILAGAGFAARSGPEIEDEFHNFTALNMPANHPARDMHDTFYLPSGMLFEREVDVRFRASYFPFTEPSAEMDVRWEDGGWLEILGCGMVHPEVLRFGGVDPERYTGYAFGMGVERMAMLRYGVRDIRRFFDNDIRFLGQFAP